MPSLYHSFVEYHLTYHTYSLVTVTVAYIVSHHHT